eukprot:TRINITY_DN11686_c0_g1_i1.p1 TRINITY_DN11686_c0_g1~~TRINITY_DN11686_c0_g1_i1.p1  ORF type:complete len:534 (+),score=76.95 TRINITY_DN11686_c0_g1_i1:147-1604(+)
MRRDSYRRLIGLLVIGALGAAAGLGLYRAWRKSGVGEPWAVWALASGGGLVCTAATLALYRGEHDGHQRALTALTLFPVTLLYPMWPSVLWANWNHWGVLVLPGWLFVSFYTQMFMSSPPLAHLRSTAYNLLLSYPATMCAAVVLLSVPLLPLAAWGPWQVQLGCFTATHFLALLGVLQSAWPPPAHSQWEEVAIDCGPGVPDVGTPVQRLRPCAPVSTYAEAVPLRLQPAREVRFVQLTDMHLGPYMSVARLQKICQGVVALNPELVFLTGDFHTPESQLMCAADSTPLATALAPLTALRGRCFACLGNHDVDQPLVRSGVLRDMQKCGIRMLIDEAVTAQCASGPVQIVGMDWRDSRDFSDAGSQLLQALRPSQPCFVMLHAPEDFNLICDIVPPNCGTLVLSGHTHGGQVGLLSFGCDTTLVALGTGHPDHGLWGKGKERCYVHRAQGFRSLSCTWIPRLGVPAEFSVCTMRWFQDAASGSP